MKNSNIYSRRTFLRSSGIMLGSTLPFILIQPITKFLQNFTSKINDYESKQRSKLLKDNETFVKRIAESYKGQGLSHFELVELGNNGLLKAAKYYDNTRGYPFISYAVWWIRQAMLQGLAMRKARFRNLKYYFLTTHT